MLVMLRLVVVFNLDLLLLVVDGASSLTGVVVDGNDNRFIQRIYHRLDWPDNLSEPVRKHVGRSVCVVFRNFCIA